MADATKLIDALRRLATALNNSGKNDPTKFSDRHGVNAAPINAFDLGYMAEIVCDKFDNFDWSESDESTQELFDDLAPKIEWATGSLVPQIQSSFQPSFAIASLLYSVDIQISSQITPFQISKAAQVPLDLKRDVTKASGRLNAAMNGIGEIEAKISKINSAYDAATKLPTTLEDLEQALADIQGSRDRAQGMERDARAAAVESGVTKAQLDEVKASAEETMKRVNSAFRAATSHGLAYAFRAKTFWLNVSMYGWALVLILALAVAVAIGSTRFPEILKAAADRTTDGALNWSSLLLQVTLAAMSLGAPIWLAWVSTKQIGQRFRLAEDYAYKAALSAAYEGYRSEASELDPLLKAQLFSIAITRLDEIPLRLIEQDVHGSPLHELLKSPEFKSAIQEVPGLKDRAISILGRFMSKATSTAKESTESPTAAA